MEKITISGVFTQPPPTAADFGTIQDGTAVDPKRTVGNAGLAQMPAARNTRRERLLSWAEIRHRDRPAPGYGYGSLIRHAGLAQAREVGGFGEGADRHPISACLQASEARIAIITS